MGKNFITITLLNLLLISAALTSSGVYDLIGEDGYENLPDEHHAEYIYANGVYTIRATPRCPVPENSTDNHNTPGLNRHAQYVNTKDRNPVHTDDGDGATTSASASDLPSACTTPIDNVEATISASNMMNMQKKMEPS